MITTAFLLGGLSVTGFYLVYSKFPPWAKNFLVRRPLFTDAVAAIAVYVLFGSNTVTGLLAAAWAGVITSFLLAARKNKGIMALFEKGKSMWRQALTWVETWGQEKEKEREATSPEDFKHQEAEEVIVG